MVEKRRPRNKDELQEAIWQYWDEIPLPFIRACIESLQRKMAKALADANRKLPEDRLEI